MPPRTPTALTTFLACGHASILDRARAAGLIGAPAGIDPTRDLLAQRGELHEKRYIAHLQHQGLTIVDLRDAPSGNTTDTLAHMQRGTDAIIQAPLAHDNWQGRADVLRRVETPSELGAWSYEVVDTKLSRETKVATVLQLGLYSYWLAGLQGVVPRRFFVVMPGEPFVVEGHRVQDYAAYLRYVQGRFARETDPAMGGEDVAGALAGSRPEPCAHCEVCRWWLDCKQRWAAEDDLCRVAGLTRLQRRELQRVGISTLTRLATEPAALPARPEVGAAQSYVRVHHQARVQWRGTQAGAPVHELLSTAVQVGDAVAPDELGIAGLPAPTGLDVFLDLEGDPFCGIGGREYLFGLSWVGEGGSDEYRAIWGLDEAGEKAAFEAAIDAITERRAAEPGMHVFHFGAYETAALKRLVGRYATRADELDRLLRGEVFVDLHRVVKTSLRASVESYSIKELEPLFAYDRELDLAQARRALRRVEAALELGDLDDVDAPLRAEIEAYNADDCRATRWLRDWLETLRTQVQDEHGVALPRPAPKDDAASEAVVEADAEVEEVRRALLEGVADDPSERDEAQTARVLLAHMLEFHRREEKASVWDKFRLMALTEDDREDERAVVAGLVFDRRESVKQSWVHHYTYAPQEVAVDVGDSVFDADGNPRGTVHELDAQTRRIALKQSKAKCAELDGNPDWVFVWKHVRPKPKPEALRRLGRALAAGETDGASASPWAAATQLLRRAPPRLQPGHDFRPRDGESGQDRARRLVGVLDRTVLAIQGPPGTGKTHTGAEMIVDLVLANKKVGVTAMSHAVIRNLVDRVLEAAHERGVTLTAGVKPGARSEDPGRIVEHTDNDKALGAIAGGQVDVFGATPWLWARADAQSAVDVLFVDEAGQLALADVLAVAAAADSLVLLGDPQQLEQPRRATHPEGSDVSALGHVLGDAATIADDRGIFLAETWRLPPKLCALTSELYYDGKLRGIDKLQRRALVGTGELGLDGSGLWWLTVEHEARSVVAPEEVTAVRELVSRLLDRRDGGVSWVDMEGERKPLTADEVLVIAPYNAQVAALREALGEDARTRSVRVGTVDKFQGQQAAVVIYSATSSTAADAPRGIGFLY